MEHKIDHKTEVGCQRKEVSLGVRGQHSKVRKMRWVFWGEGVWGCCKTSKQRMEISDGWETRKKPGCGSGPSAGPQRAFQTGEGFSGSLWYCTPRDVSGGTSPLGPPGPTLPDVSKPSCPLPQVCGVQQAKCYCPHTGAALQ